MIKFFVTFSLIISIATMSYAQVVIDFEDLGDDQPVDDFYPGLFFDYSLKGHWLPQGHDYAIEGEMTVHSTGGFDHWITCEVPIDNFIVTVACGKDLKLYCYDVTGEQIYFERVERTLEEYPGGYQITVPANGISYMNINCPYGHFTFDLFGYDLRPGQIAGTVIDDVTQEPIANALVWIKRGDFSKWLTTDSDGYYKQEGLADGTYTVRCFKGEYENQMMRSTVSVGTLQDVSFALMPE